MATNTQQLVKILVINPNSSQSITECLERLLIPPPLTSLHFFTGPPTSPPSIDDEETSIQSSAACIPELIPILKDFDAFLVACYSDHPLVSELRDQLHFKKPVIGILEASISHSLLVGKRFGIVTTGKVWEGLLSTAVYKFLGLEGGSQKYGDARFAGVASTGLGVLELHEADGALVKKRIAEAAQLLVETQGADVICLGCAGMAGMDEAVRSGVSGADVRVIDGAVVGVHLLSGLARTLST